MAKKADKKTSVAVTKFSVMALNTEIEDALKRLKGVPSSPAKNELRRKLQALQLIADCGQDMAFDL